MSKRVKFNVTPHNAHEFLPAGTRLIVHHRHPGNSSAKERRIKGGAVSPYITHAFIVRESDDKYPIKQRILANASAVCAPHDNPRRDLSYRIAAGRAVRALYADRRSAPLVAVS